MVALGFLIVGDAGPAFLPVTLIGVLGLWAASVLTLITGWQYVREGLGQIVRASKGQKPASKRRTSGNAGTAEKA